MNIDDWFWIRECAWLAAKMGVLVVLGSAAVRLAAAPRTRALVWQSVFLCLGLLLIVEATGFKWNETAREEAREVRVEGNLPVAGRTADQSPSKDSAFLSGDAEVESVTWPGILWAAGTLVLLTKLCLSRLLLVVARRRLQPADSTTLEMVDRLRRTLVAPRIRACSSDFFRGPAAFGLIRPTLVVPSGFAKRFDATQREAIVAHEVAHLAARDPFWSLLSELVCAVAWWNPAVWSARRQLLRASELAADEAAAVVNGGRTALAECLVQLGREFSVRRRFYPVFGGAGGRSELQQRVARLLQAAPSPALSRRRSWIVRLCAVVFASVALLQMPRAALPSLVLALLQGEKAPTPTNAVATVSGILTDPQFKAVITALEQKGAAAAPTTNLQVRISARMAEIKETANDLGMDWLFGSAGNKAPMRLDHGGTNFVPGTGVLKGRDVQIEHLRFEGQFALLTGEQAQALIGVLERKTGVDILSAPKVSTLSGRQARISVTDARTLVTDVPRDDLTKPGTEQIWVGQMLDVLPEWVNGVWRIQASSSFVEFLGYRKAGEPPLSRAQVRVRDTISVADVPPGHTLVMRAAPVTEKNQVKRFYVFLTPETIDEKGFPVKAR